MCCLIVVLLVCLVVVFVVSRVIASEVLRGVVCVVLGVRQAVTFLPGIVSLILIRRLPAIVAVACVCGCGRRRVCDKRDIYIYCWGGAKEARSRVRV